MLIASYQTYVGHERFQCVMRVLKVESAKHEIDFDLLVLKYNFMQAPSARNDGLERSELSRRSRVRETLVYFRIFAVEKPRRKQLNSML